MKLYSIDLTISLSKEQYTNVMRALSAFKHGAENDYDITTTPNKVWNIATTGYTVKLETSKPEIVMAALKAMDSVKD